MRPLRPCPVPSCPALVSSGRCPAHSQSREQRNPHKADVQKFYNSTRWKKVRAIVRRRDVLCAECGRAESQTVDHMGELEDLRLEMLRGLCWGCHNRKSGRKHSGKRRG